MRIAIVAEVFLPKIDGVVGRTLNLIRELLGNGDEVVVVCPAVSQHRDSPVPMIECQGFPCASYPEYIIGVPNQSMVRQLVEFQPDVIHFLNPFAFGFQCFDLLQQRGIRIPALFSFHTLYGEFVKGYAGLQPLSRVLWWLMRCYHNAADRNLTVSSTFVDDLRERGFDRLSLWPPAVDTKLFHPSRQSNEMRSRLSGNHPDRPLLLTVSRLAPEKNVSFLTSVLDRIPEATLAIVGGGPQKDELQRRFSRYKTQFIGYLQGEDLAAAYASADTFIYASETETMGNVILEALASGLPVVAADAGGVPSLIENGVNGFLYPARDSKTASCLARQILHNTELRKRMSVAAVESTSTRTWQNSAASVRRQYVEILAESATADTHVPVRMAPLSARICTRTLVRLFRMADWILSDSSGPSPQSHSTSLPSPHTVLSRLRTKTHRKLAQSQLVSPQKINEQIR